MALLAAVLSCGRQQPERHLVMPRQAVERTEQFVLHPELEATACPLQIEGTHVVLAPVSGGAALVFTAATGETLRVRMATRRLAALYDTPLPPAEATGETAEQYLEPAPLGVPTRVEYSDVAAGARMEVTAISPHEVRVLRRRLRAEVVRMQRTRSCTLEPDMQAQKQ